jgi:hypothetical protein
MFQNNNAPPACKAHENMFIIHHNQARIKGGGEATRGYGLKLPLNLEALAPFNEKLKTPFIIIIIIIICTTQYARN